LKQIPLTKGYSAFVDDDVYEEISHLSWQACEGPYTTYAVRSVRNSDGSFSKIRMHRLICNAEPGMRVDHADRNGLNNLRSNLRVCSNSENMGNRKSNKNSSSQFKGVSWSSTKGRWVVQLQDRFLGSFNNEIEAAKAYDLEAARAFGKFALLNFPESGVSSGL
jgi:hypothetical protein